MPHGDESDPSIYEFIDKNEKPESDNICNYLKAGSVLVAYGGVTQDIINPQNGSAGCPDILTDGIWLWPGDLVYYVKQYYLKLDDASNGLFLRIPVDDISAMSRHRGYHSTYNEFVKA